MSHKTKNPIAVWDYTAPTSLLSFDQVITFLKDNGKHWVFQKELGKSGYEHWQIRISLNNKTRTAPFLANGHPTPTSNTGSTTFDYVMKEETRIEGPWDDKSYKEEPWDLAMIKEWHPWQSDIFKSLKKRDDRIINVLVDHEGGIGKSKVFKKALYEEWAGVIPVIGDAKDIIQACCSMGPYPAYIVDFPRSGESELHTKSIFKAIEQIKNGVVMDFRYNFKKLIMGSPVIWIFTNETPNLSYLSKDRWRLYSINKSSKHLEGLNLGTSL